MKPYSCKVLAVFAVTALGLTLTGCQQAPPAATQAAPAQTTAPPTSSTESSSRSVEVKSNPDGSEKSVTKDSTTTKQQQ